jgi:hypothetical protein
MKMTPIVERLKGAGCKRVYGALELAAIKDAPGILPQHFVVPDGSEASPNETIGVHDQRVAGTFMVVLVLEGTARREDAVSEQLHDEEARVIDALAGWTPEGATRACDFLGARLLSVSASTVSWGVRFRTAWRLRKHA